MDGHIVSCQADTTVNVRQCDSGRATVDHEALAASLDVSLQVWYSYSLLPTCYAVSGTCSLAKMHPRMYGLVL